MTEKSADFTSSGPGDPEVPGGHEAAHDSRAWPLPPPPPVAEPVEAILATGLEFRGSGLAAGGGRPEDASVAAVSLAQAAPSAETPARRERSGTLEALILILFAFLMALSLKTYVAEAYEIKGNSMKPTFLNGQRVVVLKAFYELKRGDIVVFSSLEDPGKDLIKRIIGLPGETVQINRGRVLIDGEPLDEDYVLGEDRGRFTSTCDVEKVKEGSYYVLGDNRPDSHDSRFFHAIPADSIKGKVVVRWWPMGEFRSF